MSSYSSQVSLNHALQSQISANDGNAEDNIPPLLPSLLPPLTEILKTTTQDPTPLLSLTIKLLSPLSFTRTLTIADPPSLLAALRAPLPGANLLALAIIHKAAKAPSDASILSTLPEVVEELIRRWLETADTGVGERAAKVLGDLLEVDCEVTGDEANGLSPGIHVNGNEIVRHHVPGHGRLWRLILLSRPNLSLIQSLCVSEREGEEPTRTSHQITIAQGRLLRLLPRLCALNIEALTQSVIAGLFTLPATVGRETGEGLLQWAALGMVDKSDILMRLTLVDFFETLVSIMRVSRRSTVTDIFMKNLVGAAIQDDSDVEPALRSLPDRTIEEEAEPLRRYISDLLS